MDAMRRPAIMMTLVFVTTVGFPAWGQSGRPPGWLREGDDTNGSMASWSEGKPKERHRRREDEEEELEPGAATPRATEEGDQEVFRRVLSENSRPFAICFARALRDDRMARGRVVIEATVNADGVVSAARIVSSTLEHRDAERCMVEAFEAIRFPRPRSGTAVDITHAMSFESPNRARPTGAAPSSGGEPSVTRGASPSSGGGAAPSPHDGGSASGSGSASGEPMNGVPSTATSPSRPSQGGSGGQARTEDPLVERLRRHLLADVQPVVECYRRALGEHPGLRGQLTIRFVVQPTGVVREARVTRSTLPHTSLEQCMLDAVLAHRFPLLVQPGDVVVEHTFMFSPE